MLVRGIISGSGLEINGPARWDPQVRDPGVYNRFLAEGRLGLGESFLEGGWDCEALDAFFSRLLTAGVVDRLPWRRVIGPVLLAKLRNRLHHLHAPRNIAAHYDLGNRLFEAMLDPRMVYSCAYWKEAGSLAEAQEAKLELVCRKLDLQAGHTVLDLGCGWGSFARYAAERYGVRVTGVTLSQSQLELGRELCAGLPVELRLQHYRDVAGQFDRIVSLGMFEHVGYSHYRAFMRQIRGLLKAGDSRFLLQTIGGRHAVRRSDPWMEKYIFPGGMLPTTGLLAGAADGVLILEDWHNFGADYDKTLMAWWANFDAHWPELRPHYDERFYRIWRYYLHFCAATFRSRYNQLWQVLYSRNGIPGGITPVR